MPLTRQVTANKMHQFIFNSPNILPYQGRPLSSPMTVHLLTLKGDEILAGSIDLSSGHPIGIKEESKVFRVSDCLDKTAKAHV